MKFIKKHKGLVFFLVVVIAVAIALLIVKDTISFDETEAIYGNRLEGIEKVQITKEQEQQIKEALKDTTEKVTVRLAGRIVYLNIHTKPEVTQEVAKGYGNTVLAIFSTEQKSYYDFQFMISNAENKEQFPILGYKQRTKQSISWTVDR